MCAIYYSSYSSKNKIHKIPSILSFHKTTSKTTQKSQKKQIFRNIPKKIPFIYLFLFHAIYTCEPELVCVPIGDFPVLGAIWYPKQYEISLQKKEKRKEIMVHERQTNRNKDEIKWQ